MAQHDERTLEMALHLAFDERSPGDGMLEVAASGRWPARRGAHSRAVPGAFHPLGALARRADEAVAGEGATALWRPSDTRDALAGATREFLGLPVSTLRYVLISPARDVEFSAALSPAKVRRGHHKRAGRRMEALGRSFGAVPLPSLINSNDALYGIGSCAGRRERRRPSPVACWASCRRRSRPIWTGGRPT